jgi:hypothetical protein
MAHGRSKGTEGGARLTPPDGWDYPSSAVPRAVVVFVVMLAVAGARSDVCAEAPSATLALKVCQQADDLPEDDKLGQLAILDRGVKLAEASVAAHPDDARAQLALSCNLGKELGLAGISWRSLQRLNRLKAVIDTAYQLAPDDPDVIVAKGELLRRIPSVLGGDVHEAELHFRRALAKNGQHLQGHLCLAHLLADRDDPDAGREAALALSLAKERGTPRQIADAQALARAVPR